MNAVGGVTRDYRKSLKLKQKKKPTLEVAGWLCIPCFVCLDLNY